MDYGLHDQHSSYIRRQSLRGEEDDVDLDASWVMLSRSGEIEPLPNERILHKTRGRVSFELSAVNVSGPAADFSRKSDQGTAYITNQRVIYLPAKPLEDFKSFSSRILGCQDTRTDSSWFGPWYWQATVRPVPDGNIPPEVTWAKVKFIFNDGGFSEFQAKFVEINGRLHHAAQLAQETGQTHLLQTVHDEELPEYRPRQATAEAAQTETTAAREADEANQRQAQQGQQQVPDEPPPNYDEAQAQAISMQFDERAREEADRE